MKKIPKLAFQLTRLQQKDDPILPLRNLNYTLHLFFTINLCCYLIKKQELGSMVVSVLLKIKFGHTQISVPKIGKSRLKTVCINPC